MIKKDLQKVIREFLSNNRTSLITEVSDETLDLQQKFFNDMLVNKSGIVKRYGKDAEKVMKGKAMNLAKKETEKMNKQKLKELVKKTLTYEADIEVGAEKYFGEKDLSKASMMLDTLESQLKNHDWFHMMSDDHSAYTRGSVQQSKIRGLMKNLEDMGYGDDAKSLYNQYAPSQFTLGEAKAKKSFPDLTGDGKVTKADILKGRGIELKEYISESGLMVFGRTPLDNNAIGDYLDETDYYAAWNAEYGYWFFPEQEKFYDELENELSQDFNKLGIDARFEGIFSESFQKVLDANMSESKVNETSTISVPKLSDIDHTRIIKWMTNQFDSKSWDMKKSGKGFEISIDKLSKAEQEDLMAYLKSQDYITESKDSEMNEDIDLGHEDNEPHMIKGELYQIGKYSMELYAALEELEEMGGEYDFPAWWQAKITTAKNNISGAKHYLEFELNEPKIDAAVDAMTGEEYHEGEPMMEKKLTKAEKAKKEDIVKGMKKSFKGDESAMYAIATSKAKKVAETLAKKLKND